MGRGGERRHRHAESGIPLRRSHSASLRLNVVHHPLHRTPGTARRGSLLAERQFEQEVAGLQGSSRGKRVRSGLEAAEAKAIVRMKHEAKAVGRMLRVMPSLLGTPFS